MSEDLARSRSRRTALVLPWLFGLLGLAAVAGVAFLVLPYAGVPLTDGPLRKPPAHAAAITRYDVGDRFTYGLNDLAVEGSDEAVITSIEVAGLDEGVRFLGARLGGPDRRVGSRQLIDRWPPRDRGLDVRPLSTPVEPLASERRGYELFVGLEIEERGRFRSEGWLITYEVAGRTHEYLMPARLLICAGPGQATDDCSPPGAG
ncbi:MAG: hypothetical protein AVDCRST_MAG36-1781 [uncultured Nocardioidaceae bacterium]|uniref:Uncharacterized protein n=1 Tax=uncultured Nocardioidaceae bacterium TaxID=253824 RepID=A0A6J4M4V5_9ACTN|nr:MAG: hypothetical protein AVDCRST_MAG36-1781 [uncultured Nocardioidaceae bacterium]